MAREEGGVHVDASASLQGFGRSLDSVPAAADEVAAAFAKAEEAEEVARVARLAAAERADLFRRSLGAATTMAGTELPTSAVLNADLQATEERAKRAETSDEWRGVVADAEALAPRYRREHETDIDRVEAPRGGLAVEQAGGAVAAVLGERLHGPRVVQAPGELRHGDVVLAGVDHVQADEKRADAVYAEHDN